MVAIHAFGSKLSIHGNLILVNNTAEGSGGGAFLYEAYLTCHGNYTISGNKANYTGGETHAASWIPPPV